MDCSPPGSSVHGILQARILEWVAMPFSRGSSQLRDRTQASHIAGRLFIVWATSKATNLLSSSQSYKYGFIILQLESLWSNSLLNIRLFHFVKQLLWQRAVFSLWKTVSIRLPEQRGAPWIDNSEGKKAVVFLSNLVAFNELLPEISKLCQINELRNQNLHRWMFLM